MEHAITIKDILIVGGVIAGFLVVGGVLLGIVWLLNPFRSGH